jgi:hypothetical protein
MTCVITHETALPAVTPPQTGVAIVAQTTDRSNFRPSSLCAHCNTQVQTLQHPSAAASIRCSIHPLQHADCGWMLQQAGAYIRCSTQIAHSHRLTEGIQTVTAARLTSPGRRATDAGGPAAAAVQPVPAAHGLRRRPPGLLRSQRAPHPPAPRPPRPPPSLRARGPARRRPPPGMARRPRPGAHPPRRSRCAPHPRRRHRLGASRREEHSSTARLYSTPLQHYSTALLYSTPLQHSSTALLYSTPLQHSSTALLYSTPLQHSSTALLYSTALQHCSTALLYSTPLQHSSIALLYSTPLQHSSTALLYSTPLQHSSTALLYGEHSSTSRY